MATATPAAAAATTHLTSAKPLGSGGSPFSRTLQEITTTKLNELSKKRDRFEERMQALLARTAALQDPLEFLEAWSHGVKQCFDVPVREDGRVIRYRSANARLEIDLINIDRFLGQARYDPSISPRVRQQWQQTLQRHIDVQSLKYAYAKLFGHLTTESLAFRAPAAVPAPAPAPDNGDTEMEDFEHVAASKRLESRLEWEKQVFEPAQVKLEAIDQLLRDSFEPSGENQKPLRDATRCVRAQVRDFGDELDASTAFNEESLGWVIRGLLGSDLLTDEQREVLRDFQSNNVILTEIADVLNMWISAPETWSWGKEVNLEDRRGVDGSFRIFLHEDLLQAIFLHYIGIRWSVAMKGILRSHHLPVWGQSQRRMPARDRNRREYFLGEAVDYSQSVAAKLQDVYYRKYFLSLLPDSEEQSSNAAEGDEEANFEEHANVSGHMPKKRTRQTARQAQTPQMPVQQVRRKFASKDARKHIRGRIGGDDDSEDRNPMDAKQTLLHLLSTEILVQNRLHGEITCFRSQLAGLFPSLPHQTIIQVLKFFGTPPRWIQFFQNFLRPPLRFTDDREGSTRTRQRGVPSSHALSELFSEVILFVLDFQVNQVTGGERLWRMHDDFWFWSAKETTCEAAWKTITSFSQTMGLDLNSVRTGCARMRRSKNHPTLPFDSLEPSKNLPRGQIRWGMLLLKPETGRFEIDDAMVDKHIQELSHQLKEKSGSVFAWIQAWNTYAATFFTSNFGKPANCFGREHVDSMLATHERIQRELFASLMGASGQEGSGSVVEYLKQTITQRFGVEDIPDGYFYFPVELGGLDLQSPFIPLLQIRDTVVHKPTELLDIFEITERSAYKQAKERYERGEVRRQPSGVLDPNFKPANPEEFLSFEEFTRYREYVDSNIPNSLSDVFSQLLNRPQPAAIDSEDQGQIMLALNALGNQLNLRGILSNWYMMEPYWKWVVQLYGAEMIERFGGLSIVDPGLLPIGMVGLFRSGRVKWQE